MEMRIRGEHVLVMTEWRGGDARRRASSREMPSLLFLSEYPASTHLISSDLGGAEGDLGGLCFIPEARASFQRTGVATLYILATSSMLRGVRPVTSLS